MCVRGRVRKRERERERESRKESDREKPLALVPERDGCDLSGRTIWGVSKSIGSADAGSTCGVLDVTTRGPLWGYLKSQFSRDLVKFW